ncbi:MAG: sterol desaturase family protein [Cyclobacteriaceae bacterium]
MDANEIFHFFLHSALNAWALTFVFFLVLYFSFAGVAFLISYMAGTQFKIDSHPYPTSQITKEIKLSLVSISIFSFQTALIQQIMVRGWATVNFSFHLSTLIIELIILFLWNEIHFYAIHWLLHRKWWFRNIHYIHHQSYHPTPFSVYSFSWVEAMLLGSVIFVPLLAYDFQGLSLLSLPIVSIALNVMGHWDYDFFPQLKSSHWLRASFRHSLHHRKVHGNFGFQLHVLDKVFKTEIKN